MNLISIPALQDNYIWLLDDQQGTVIIVDPGEAAPVLAALNHHNLTPTAILLTHHHHDHVGGVNEILQHYPQVALYGPQETAAKFRQITLKQGDEITLGQQNYRIFDVPGHTSGHIAYYSAPYLFCGDTMFSGGCGRLFEGTARQMYQSFQQLTALPEDTLVCCAHEYTLANLKFARSILPQDRDIETYEQQVQEMRKKGVPSVPTTLEKEHKINVFLRCHDADLQKKLGFVLPVSEPWQVFARLRERKDTY
ncbi:hydroxyacylglutathione hydrolase [Chimaeribacter californicus]|uniref:Hydroxyacylglutathione hydrolase n=1 Tax=Chimaeribacter californicus TaxID=2060067 RepID=A0A2N5E5V2_9GAMM|nr:hydroxyacylglutathione hydrolase [Chimaeribacter californicus]PLR36710.1 hydroxyacylglutathione hydrolase [Chimaeribacter californicus]